MKYIICFFTAFLLIIFNNQITSAETETIRVVIVEGNTLFSGTYSPQDRPFGDPYPDETALTNAKFTAERNGKLFLLDEQGVLYYPCPEQGTGVSESMNSPRIRRKYTSEQEEMIKGGKKLEWFTSLVPLTGEVVEVEGIIYPGYSGIKGIYIKSITYEEEP